MSLNRQQIETRLRSMRWQIPGMGIRNLWGSEGKNLISVTLMRKLIDEALLEWAAEMLIDRRSWTLDDGSGGEGTLTVDQRKYALPNDILVITDAFVAYNDTSGFLGYPLVAVHQPYLDSSLSMVESLSLAGPGVQEYNYSDYTLAAGTTFPLTITYASLGADVNGNTPPSQFASAPHFTAIGADVDVDVYVASRTATDFVINIGAFSSSDLPFDINFTFKDIGAALLQQVNAQDGLPQRMFIWNDQFWLDPIPDKQYTFRMFGYQLPTSLTADASSPTALSVYHRSIMMKCKQHVAQELSVVNEAQIQAQYASAAIIAKKLDEERHQAPGFIQPTWGYWD